MTASDNTTDELFGGKSLKQNLQDIVARNNTGYNYEQLKDEIKNGEDLLEDDEIEQVDKTVNLLGHLFKHEADRLIVEARIDELERILDDFNDPSIGTNPLGNIDERLAQLRTQLENKGGE